jgi:hypothetical protein
MSSIEVLQQDARAEVDREHEQHVKDYLKRSLQHLDRIRMELRTAEEAHALTLKEFTDGNFQRLLCDPYNSVRGR